MFHVEHVPTTAGLDPAGILARPRQSSKSTIIFGNRA